MLRNSPAPLATPLTTCVLATRYRIEGFDGSGIRLAAFGAFASCVHDAPPSIDLKTRPATAYTTECESIAIQLTEVVTPTGVVSGCQLSPPSTLLKKVLFPAEG